MITKSYLILSLLQGALSGEWTMRSLPQRAVSKSCVVIPCSFDFPSHPYTAIHGAWYKYWYYWKYTVSYSKDPNYVMFQFKGRAEIVGNLAEKNCTLRINHLSHEDADVYYFYVELDGFDVHTYTPPVQLQVMDVPDDPVILLQEDLREGTPVNIICKTLYTCPDDRPSLTWSELPNATFNVIGEKRSGEISTVLTFNPTAVHHRLTVRCTVVYPTTNHRLTSSVILNVQYLPETPVIRITFNEANTITLHCSSAANPRLTGYSWIKISRGEETYQRWKGQNITVDQARAEEPISYVCSATNVLGSTRSPPIRVPSLHEAAILPVSRCTKFPTNVTCRCMVQFSLPVDVTWGFLKRTVGGTSTEGNIRTESVRKGSLVTNTLVVLGEHLAMEAVNCSVSNPRGLPPSRAELKVEPANETGEAPPAPSGEWKNGPVIPLAATGGAVLLIVVMVVTCSLVKRRRRADRPSVNTDGKIELETVKEMPKDKKRKDAVLTVASGVQRKKKQAPETRSTKQRKQRDDIYENYDGEFDSVYANVD